MMTLKSFPRGGKKPATNPASTAFRKDVKSKKNRGKKEQEVAHREEEKFIAKTAECLTYSSIGEGMTLLGRIQEVTQYDMTISLPGRLGGKLQVTDFGKRYTKLLEGIVESKDEDTTKFKAISDLYRRGEYIVCCVKSLDRDEKRRVSLSLDPELINRNVDPTKLEKRSKIVGTIGSVEDHGYLVDTGIDNLRSFLANEDVDRGVEYFVGKQVFCAVRRATSSENSTTVRLSTKAKHVASAILEDAQSLDAIVPGSKLVVEINNVLSNGLRVSFNENANVGYINRMYSTESLSSFQRGRKLEATLMYVMPTVKFAYFTLLPMGEERSPLNVGDIVEKSKVMFTGSNGVVLSLKKDVRGIVPFRRTEVEFEKIPAIFSPDSTHKCRVIAYDSFEQIYICTMERRLLEEKYFGPASLVPGQFLEVEIARMQPETGYIMVRAGRTRGWVPPEHVRDVDSSENKTLALGDMVRARVLGRDKLKKGVQFTLKKSLIDSTAPILGNIDEAQVGGKHDGTIVQINGKGLLVRFYDGVKGWIPRQSLDKRFAAVKWNFIIGQVITTQIEAIDRQAGKLTLSLVTEEPTRQEPRYDCAIGQAIEGIVVEASLQGLYIRIIDDAANKTIGFLPAGHASPCQEVGSYLTARHAVGDRVAAIVFSTSPRLILTMTRLPLDNNLHFNNIKVGDCIAATIHEISSEAIKLILPINNYHSYGIVSGNATNYHSAQRFYIHQLLFAKVTSIDKKKGKINLTIGLADVNDAGDSFASLDLLALYFNSLRRLSENVYYNDKAIGKAQIGERVSGIVEKVTNDGLVLKLDTHCEAATVRNDHYRGKLKIGDRVNGSIIWINYVHELAEVTLLPSIVNAVSTKQSKLSSRLPLESQLRGDIILITNWFILVVLKGAGKGCLAALPVRRHLNDIEPDLTSFTLGKRIRCYIVLNKSESDILPVGLFKSSFETHFLSCSIKPPLKRKRQSREDHDDRVVKSPVKKIKKTQPDVAASMSVDEISPDDDNRFTAAMDSPVESEEAEEESCEKGENGGLEECGFFWDDKPDESLGLAKESSSEDDGDGDDEPREKQAKKKKKPSAADRRESEKQKEQIIREREEALARSNEAPNSVDQYDRLVLASPDSSVIWLDYMAHHLQATEIEKARAVAKRAIKTINYRQEAERLAVWQAWLNLESRFGTSETLNEVFQDAVKTNDPKVIHLHMLTVYADAGKRTELDNTVATILRKFKEFPQVWIECGAALLKMGLLDKSRHVMQRCLSSLPPQEHVNLMVKFAQMENKLGDKERAQTLFEQILNSYPKRVDVWSSYVDTLVKSEQLDIARKVLEKAVVQQLPARKMKTLLKKFIGFEEKYGTPEGVARVQQLALKYVENQCSKQ